LPAVIEEKQKSLTWLHWGPSETNKIYPENIKLEQKIPYLVVLSKENMRAKKAYHKNLYKIGHAIDPAFKPLAKKTIVAQRKKLGFKSTDFICGTLSVNNVRKQLIRLLEGFQIFAENKKNAKLIIFTTSLDLHDQQSTDLEYYVNTIFKLTDKVKIIYTDRATKPLTPQELNACFYNIIDVFVSATAGEGFCIPVGEAMACGKPTIITNCENISELVIHNKTGLLCKIKTKIYDLVPRTYSQWRIIDSSNLAKNINLLYQNKTLLKKLGVQGYKHIQNNFTLPVVISKFEALFAKSARFNQTKEQTVDTAYINSWLGLEYFKYGYLKEALAILADLNTAPIHNLRGIIYKRLNIPDKAKTEFQRALQIDPNFELAKQALSQITKE